MSALEQPPAEEPPDLHAVDDDPNDGLDYDPMADRTYDEPPPDPPSIREKLDRALVRGADVLDLAAPEPLIADVLDIGTLSVMYGRPGCGKSFLALDMALHIASGAWWHGHEVRQGPVLYVAAEGQTGLGIRAAAWAALNRTTIPAAITWLTRPANLLNPQATHALAEIAGELGAIFVVIDTLNRSMAGGEENSSKDMSAVISSCDLIRHTTGAHAQLIHHSGKDTSAGARGHSSLLGAVDTELEVKNGDGIITLATSKQKEAATGTLPYRFALVPAANSVAVGRYSSRTEEGAGLTATGHLCLDALDRIATDAGIATTIWRDASVTAGASRTTFYEQVKKLTELGLVNNLQSDTRPAWVLTEEARELKGKP